MYMFDRAELYPVLFVGCMLLTTSPVLWSICSRVRLVPFCHFCFGREEVCVCVCVMVGGGTQHRLLYHELLQMHLLCVLRVTIGGCSLPQWHSFTPSQGLGGQTVCHVTFLHAE